MESDFGGLLTNLPVVSGIVFGAVVVLVVYVVFSRSKADTQQKHKRKTLYSKDDKAFAHSEKKKEPPQSAKTTKKKVVDPRWSGRSDKQGYSHPWLLTSLKGHTGSILDMDFSSNGKYLVSCGDDRAVFIWDTKDLTQRDRKSLRVNIEFDYATMVKWSPDSKAFIINRFNENTVEVYKVDKKRDGWLNSTKAVTFPKFHETDVIGMGIASNGKFIMTCSNKTDMVIWDLKEQKLAQIDTYLMNTTCAKISPCGRFIVASGFTPEARVWEVIFNKAGEFQEVKQINQLTLKGHTSGVYDVAFDVDSSHMVTVSKDGTWCLFDTKVNYKLGEDARSIRTGKYEQSANRALVALSPNAEVIVVATSSNLAFYSTLTGELDHTIEDVYSGHITAVMFDSTGRYLLTSGDKQIRVFHNVTGYRCGIESAKIKLKDHQTSATKERLQKLIAEYQEFLKGIEKA